jgi:hypothetical protein
MGAGTDPEDAMDQKPNEQPEPAPEETEASDTVLLRDLAPRQDVKGGTAKLRFGESKSPETRDDS